MMAENYFIGFVARINCSELEMMNFDLTGYRDQQFQHICLLRRASSGKDCRSSASTARNVK